MVCVVLGVAACGSNDTTPPVPAQDVTSSSGDTPETDLIADMAADTVAADTATGVPDAPGGGSPSVEARGWTWTRSVVHIHSAYSHDGCDGLIDETGEIDLACIKALRKGLCDSGLAVAFMTDHPAHMKSHAFKELLFYDATAGDTLLGGEDKPWGNVITCPGARPGGLDAHDVVVTVGYEATHTMPVGLASHYTDTTHQGTAISDETPLAKAKAAVDGAHAVGGLVCNAHSEESDISAQRLVDVGVDAMEIYNIHANFKALLGQGGQDGKGDLTRVFDMEPFLGDANESPAPDLIAMIMLDLQPEQAFTKWQQVIAQRHVTGVVGNDVHQNVNLEPFCGPGGMLESLCPSLAETSPKLVAYLTKGGPLILADGKRIDSYTRALRWISNHVLLPANVAAKDRPEAMKTALKAGRSWAVFDVLGVPKGLDLVAAGTTPPVEMGGSVPLGTALTVRGPTALEPAPWATWTSADLAAHAPEVRTIVWFIASGAPAALKIAEQEGLGAVLHPLADKAGRYHIEVRITPRHLGPSLKSKSAFADKELRWAVSNPILAE